MPPRVTGIHRQLGGRIRVTGTALSYNTALALFGGTAPLVAIFLIETTGENTAPSLHLMLSAAVSLCVLIGLRETYRDALR